MTRDLLEQEIELAEKCVELMRNSEAYPQKLNIQLIETTPGHAVGKMKVDSFMLNGHKTCHGGVIFSFADTIFAYACNNRNKKAVSSGCSIDFMAPAYAGDELTAIAKSTADVGRNGIYDVVIYNQENNIIALFRGKSRIIPGEYI